MKEDEISHWCIHPGGKRILSAIERSASISSKDLGYSYEVLKEYGNMSSPTILFILRKIMHSLEDIKQKSANIFGAAFGPGLTMETFILSNE
jgi:predicted naringenin-chalcone synthase